MKVFHFNPTSITEIYCLNSVIEELRSIQDFEPSVRKLAITLHAKDLGICELHLYAIAHLAGLGGES
jgi:hypothetical protein